MRHWDESQNNQSEILEDDYYITSALITFAYIITNGNLLLLLQKKIRYYNSILNALQNCWGMVSYKCFY